MLKTLGHIETDPSTSKNYVTHSQEYPKAPGLDVEKKLRSILSSDQGLKSLLTFYLLKFEKKR